MKAPITLLAVAMLVTGVALAEPPAPPPGPDMDRLALLLDLDSYQKTEVEKVLKEQHESFRAEREAARASGTRPTREEMKAKHEAAKTELHTKLSGILNETQLKKFDALHERGPGPGPGFRGDKRRGQKDQSSSDSTSNN